MPKKSLIIEFDDSDPSIKFKMPRLRSSRIIKVQNCRKGTEDVMDVFVLLYSHGEGATVHQIGICGLRMKS